MSWNPSIYNIICWVAWMMGQTNRQPSVWCSKYHFFSWFLAKFFAKILSIYFLIFYKITKIKIKNFECPRSIRNYEKKNTWNVKRLVDDSFVPLAQQTSYILDWQMSKLWRLSHSHHCLSSSWKWWNEK